MHLIREYTIDDRRACIKIFDSNYPKYFAKHEKQEFIQWLDKKNRDSYSVIEQQKKIIACGGIYYDKQLDSVRMAWGMVHADYHAQGWGRRLTSYRLRQMDKLYANTAKSLATSQYTYQFYEKLGFVVKQIIANGYGGGFDKYEMQWKGDGNNSI